jgi:heavy metal sensor kinase
VKIFRSIRWRLQLWHGLLLALVLAGFGWTAWRLQWATQLRVAVLVGAMRPRGTRPPGPPPRDGVPPPLREGFPPPPDDGFPPPRRPEASPDRNESAPPSPRELVLSAHDSSLFAGDSDAAFYYVAWRRNGLELSRSVAAPPDETRPDRVAGARGSRLQGTLRERFHYTPSGECVLAGRDIHDELSGMRRFAWLLAGAGGAVFVLGLAGGWWVSGRALRPIGEIIATAAKISTGDLTQRIHSSDTDSELGQLAQVLNNAIARLQSAFARQVQFTADASHELRTPVSVVLTQTQTALRRERSAGEYRESLAACHRAAQRMRQLIESLLTLARLDSGEAAAPGSPCDLDRAASEAVELLRPLAEEKGVHLELELTPACCKGNVEQLVQVVSNLVSNAVCHTASGGIVQVKVASEPGAVILSVEDTGLGIAPEDLPHIFERFYRSDKARGGAAGRTGLGLAITKAIVEAHGGTMAVATELGQGSTFTVRLPGLSPTDRPQDPPS